MPWLLAAGAVAAAGNYFGSKSQASAQADAAAQNLQLQRETNAQNLDIFHQSRGSSGSAVLPEYLSGYEGSLGTSAAQVAQALFGYGGGVNGRLASANSTLAGYQPAIDQGNTAMGNLFNGTTAAQRMTSLQPVLAARTGLARSRAAAINSSLDSTLAGLRAQRAASGFRGGSTFDTNRALAATTGARMGAATELGQAGLDNATATNNLSDNNLQMLLSNLNMPFQRGQQQLAFNNLPLTSVASSYNDALAPLNFFRMGGANPPYAAAPQVPTLTNNGQITGAAVAGAGNSIGQYLSQQQMMQQLQKYFAASPSPATGAGSYTPSFTPVSTDWSSAFATG